MYLYASLSSGDISHIVCDPFLVAVDALAIVLYLATNSTILLLVSLTQPMASFVEMSKALEASLKASSIFSMLQVLLVAP